MFCLYRLLISSLTFVFILILFVHLRNALLICVLTRLVLLYTCFACHNKHTIHNFHNNVPQHPIMLLLKGIPVCDCRNVIIFPIVCCLISETFILYDPRARTGTTEVVRTLISSLLAYKTNKFFFSGVVYDVHLLLSFLWPQDRGCVVSIGAINIKSVGHLCFRIFRFHRSSKLIVCLTFAIPKCYITFVVYKRVNR
jgi:hypothetical protein